MSLEDLPLPRRENVQALLGAAGLPTRYALEPVSGGVNNRVYRVECEGAAALLKAYFRHPGDARDRLGAEFAFCRFAWERGLRSLPRPLACDRSHDLGLFEFIAGRRLSPADLGPEPVRQALDFYRELNRYKAHPAAADLPDASEACFSLAEHLACVERRLAALEQVGGVMPLDREAGAFARGELRAAWRIARDQVVALAARWGLPLDCPIDRRGEGCISPSDFGFHNAILGAEGRLRFVDFEYAGWDDPAKMVCDFFCQPALPVPVAFFEDFAAAAVAGLPQAQRHLQRIRLLLPVYRIKWCCIMLNEFLPVGARRRSFASDQDPLQRRRVQLEKARHALRQARI
jgi:hypothetical protein